MITLKTSDTQSIQPFLKHMYIPPKESHKGQNGRVLIIGGSKLFHAASLWAAEIASQFMDMVHYVSIKENEEIFIHLKKSFYNGMVVPREQLSDYINEDDSILIGPGMVRGDVQTISWGINSLLDIFRIEHEATYTYYITKYLIDAYPHKRIVFDAGSLQMMEAEWLLNMKEKPIITPHQFEFERLFGIKVLDMSLEEKIQVVKQKAQQYNCVIILKAVKDIISDGKDVFIVEGGNAGLTKGGSGDILAGLITSLFAKTDALTSAVVASYVLKESADKLFPDKGYWYNMQDIIKKIPEILKKLLYN